MFGGRVRIRMFNVIWVSLSLMVLFVAYNTVQNFVTTLLPPGVGNTSLSILYGVVAASVIVTPYIVQRIGERITLFLGGLCYVVYIVSLVHVIPGVVYAMSVVIGFGAAILWVALGAYLTSNSTPEDYGRNSGIFWGIFQLCNIIGNLIAFYLFQMLTQTMVFTTFSVIAAAGTLMLVLLRRAPTLPNTVLDPLAEERRRAGIMGTLRAVWRLLLNPTLIALWPIFFLTGFELSFWTGEFPQLLDPKIIGLVMVGAGVGDAVGGFVIGAVSDRIGRSAGVVMGTIFYAFGLYFTVVLQRNPHETDHQLCVQSYCAPWSAWCAGMHNVSCDFHNLFPSTLAVFLGLGDSGFNTQVRAQISYSELYSY